MVTTTLELEDETAQILERLPETESAYRRSHPTGTGGVLRQYLFSDHPGKRCVS
jgi:hypothetical protein